MIVKHVRDLSVDLTQDNYTFTVGVSAMHILHASLLMIHDMSTNDYYVCKNRFTGELGWVDCHEAQRLMQLYVDGIVSSEPTESLGEMIARSTVTAEIDTAASVAALETVGFFRNLQITPEETYALSP